MKRIHCLGLALVMLLAFCAGAFASEDRRVFTDSLGREVTLDKDITRIAITGPLAQIVAFALAPDMLVGVSGAWDDSAKEFLDEKYYSLPVLGQLYGGKGEMNLEQLLTAAPQVIIDVGEQKDGMREDLDALQAQTGIPFVHITATISTADEAYLKLGELLNRPEEAKTLADYCKNVYDRAVKLSESVDKVNALYILGDEGHNVIAQGSYHGEIIDMMVNNLAVVDSPSSKGTGNEVDMEQILTWNPDKIIFAPESVYASVSDEPEWQAVTAIRNGDYVEAPMGPYNWMGFPPSVQRLLGVMWLGKVLYPAEADYDLYDEVSTYFGLFYHCDITPEQYQGLVANSLLE